MKWLKLVGVALLVVVFLLVGVGLALPVSHQASVSAPVAGQPDQVWRVITDADAYSAWRPDVVRASPLPAAEGPGWVEQGSQGRMRFVVEEWEPPHRLKARIADTGLPFGGSWTYELEPMDGGARTRVTLTEDGEVYNLVFRFMARFVYGHETTMRSYLDALTARMVEQARVPAADSAPSAGGSTP